MSGGHFEYQQYRIDDIANEIVRLIHSNDDETLNDWGDPKGRHYSPATIAEFWTAVKLLRRAATYAQRIDWLVSCDDGEEQFHERLKEDLQEMEGQLSKDTIPLSDSEDEES